MITMSSGAAATRKRTNPIDELLAHDGWSRDQLLAYQHGRLRELIEHAVSASPFYREVLGQDATDPNLRLEDLPTLSKTTLMEQFDRVVTDRRLRLVDLESHAGGSDPGALLKRDYHLFMTSGTTGRRGVFPQTRAEFGHWVAAGWRALRRIDADPRARVIGIGAPTPLHITQKLFRGLGGFGAGRPELHAAMPIPALVEQLGRDQPEVLATAPSMAGMLAREQLAGRLAIRPRRILLSGEMLPDDISRTVAEAWGSEPFEVYASTETLFVASESQERVGLHINEDLVVVEVVDERGRPVPPGVPGYKVLLTSLVNRALPLIRYELADSVTLASGPDPSGRSYQRIERVDGRNDDLLRLPAIGGGEAVVLPHRLRAPFAHLPDVIQYQIVQEPHRLVVRIVLTPAAPTDTPDRVRAKVRDAVRTPLHDAGAIPPPIDVEPVDAIEREPGSAKFKLIKSTGHLPPVS